VLTNVEVYSSWASAPDLPLEMGVGEDEDPLQVRGLDGLEPVKATVNTSPFGSEDGEFYTGSSVGKRNIVMTVGFNPDWINHTVSSLREKLYGYFMSKQPVTMRFFRDDGPAVEIHGYSEGCTPNIFSQDPEVQISVICPMPDFVAVSPSVIEGVAQPNPDSHDFTAVGNIPTSVLLEVTAAEGDATTYDGTITFERKTLAPGSEIFVVTGTVADGITTRIDSKRGDKLAQVDYGPEQTNILNSMTPESVWPRITPGTNKVRVLLEAGAADKNWKLTYFDRFGGL
jgi:hypothetical protein